ncbi:MAG: hypothetical protein HFE48_01550 [Clostridia bacterium]|nr:hypothetical protein [Clostridia bacterium]
MENTIQEEITDVKMWGEESSGYIIENEPQYKLSDDSMKKIYFSFDASRFLQLGLILRATLKNRNYGAAVCEIKNGDVISGVVYNEHEYIALSCLQYGTDGKVVCCIQAADGELESRTFESQASIIIEYLPSGTFEQGQIEVGFGAGDISFSVDALSGLPRLNASLIDVSGSMLPISLSILYDFVSPLQYEETGLPNGCYTSYHETVKPYLRNTYIYTDSSRFKHAFVPSNNLPDFFVDAIGTGLVMKKQSDGGFEITDGYVYSSYFDSLGRLVKKTKKLSEYKTIESTVTYIGDSNKIMHITDALGREVEFMYDDAFTIVTYVGGATYTIAKGYENFWVIDNGEHNYFIINECTGRIEKITAANDDVLEIEYDSIGRVASVFSSSACETKYLTYDCFCTSVKNNKNVCFRYLFDSDCKFSASYEVVGDSLVGCNFVSEKACERYSGSLVDVEKYATFTFAGSENFVMEKTVPASPQVKQSGFVSVPALTEGGVCVVSARVTVLGNNNGYYEQYDREELSLEITDENGNNYGRIKFDPNIARTQVKAAFVHGFGFASAGSTLGVKFTADCSAYRILVSDVTVTKPDGTAEILCSDKDTGNGKIADGLYIVGECVSVGSSSIVLKAEDYVADERAYFTKDKHGWNMFYNGMREFKNESGDPEIKFASKKTIRFSDTLFTVVVLNKSGKAFNTFTHDSSRFASNFKYDAYMLITSVFRPASDEGYAYTRKTYYNTVNSPIYGEDDKEATDFEYDEDGCNTFSKRKSLSRATLNTVTKKSYAGGYCVSVTDYSESNADETKFTYNSLGLENTVTLPNGCIKKYSYDSFGTRLKKVSATATVENKNEIDYVQAKVSEVSGGTPYKFGYDSNNKLSSVKIADAPYMNKTYTYTDSKNSSTANYANGYVLNEVKNKYGNTVKSGKASYFYANNPETAYAANDPLSENLDVNSTSKLYKITDGDYARTVKYAYTVLGEVSSATEENEGGEKTSAAYTYNNDGTVASETDAWITPSRYDSPMPKMSYTYRKGSQKQCEEVEKTQVELSDFSIEVSTQRDDLGRPEETKTLTDGFGFHVRKNYVPRSKNYGDGTTYRVKTHRYSRLFTGDTGSTEWYDWVVDQYAYDCNGNVTQCDERLTGESAIKVYFNTDYYKYDELNRLVREKSPRFGTKTYSYDTNGNILSKCLYSFATDDALGPPIKEYVYVYDTRNKDRLISYDGKAFEYDACGNPTLYKNEAMTWTRGRLLQSFTHNGIKYSMRYDCDGLRREKAGADGAVTKYGYIGGRLAYEDYRKENETYTLKFLYAHTGIIGFEKDSKIYLYSKSGQGDIVGICDVATGLNVALYSYDAWGNCTVYNPNLTENTDADFIGNINPIRYRGYYYDADMSLYYLQTRYYDSETGRFVNLDMIEYLAPDTINGLNLYAYCLNNPVMNTDPSGTFLLSLFLISTAIGIAVGFGTSVVSQGVTKGWDNINWGQVALDTAIGGLTGAVGGSGIGAVGTVILNGTISLVGSVGGDLISSGGDWNEVNWVKAGISGLFGAIGGLTSKNNMTDFINNGYTTGSQAFLDFGVSVADRSATQLARQTSALLFSNAVIGYNFDKMVVSAIIQTGTSAFGALADLIKKLIS